MSKAVHLDEALIHSLSEAIERPCIGISWSMPWRGETEKIGLPVYMAYRNHPEKNLRV